MKHYTDEQLIEAKEADNTARLDAYTYKKKADSASKRIATNLAGLTEIGWKRTLRQDNLKWWLKWQVSQTARIDLTAYDIQMYRNAVLTRLVERMQDERIAPLRLSAVAEAVEHITNEETYVRLP